MRPSNSCSNTRRRTHPNLSDDQHDNLKPPRLICTQGLFLGVEVIKVKPLIDDAEEKTEWIIENVLASGASTILYGAPGSGKSNLVYTMMTALETGGAWLGHAVPEKHHRVLYFHVDPDEKGAVKHLTAAYRSVGVDAASIWERRMIWAEEDKWEKVREVAESIGGFVDKHGVSVVVVDTLQGVLRGVDTNDNAAVRQRLDDLFNPAMRAGAAILVIDHTSKANTNAPKGGNTPLGAGAKLGWARCAVLVEGKNGNLTVSRYKGNWKDWPAVKIKLNFKEDEEGELETLTYDLENQHAGMVFDTPSRPSQRTKKVSKLRPADRARERILSVLENQPEARAADLARDRTEKRVLADMKNEGLVRLARYGVYVLAA
jgi:AAA domain